MPSTDCARIRPALGAYVLGGLEPVEAADVRTHLATCAECRAAYDEIAPLPRLLSMVSAAQAEAGLGDATDSRIPNDPKGFAGATDVNDPTELSVESGVAGTLARIRVERRRAQRRRVVTLVAAAAAIAVVGIGGWVTSRWTMPDPSPVADGPAASVGEPVRWTATNPDRAVDAEVTMVPVPWGTRVDLTLNGVERGKLCHLVIVDRNGAEWSAGSWEVAYDGGVRWSGGVGVRAGDVEKIVVYLPNQDPLVTLQG